MHRLSPRPVAACVSRGKSRPLSPSRGEGRGEGWPGSRRRKEAENLGLLMSSDRSSPHLTQASPLPQGAERVARRRAGCQRVPSPLHGERAGVRGGLVAASVRRRKEGFGHGAWGLEHAAGAGSSELEARSSGHGAGVSADAPPPTVQAVPVAQHAILLYRRLAVSGPTVGARERLGF